MFYRKTPASKHTVDLSFLSNEEVSAILDVLERNKQLQRMNNERLKEIKKKNHDKLWLKGITGQWFEEIRRAKFKDQTDLTQILKGSHTWNLKKQNRTALGELKFLQAKDCPQSKNGVNHIKLSGNSRKDDDLDPVSGPTASSESVSQDIQSHSEQSQCSNYKSLRLEAPNMFQQIQVRLKAAAVPHVERKMHVFRGFSKQIQSNVLSQDLETNNIDDAANKHEMFLGTEDLSNSELQRNITYEKGGKSYDHLAKIHRNGKANTLQKSSKLSENARVQSLPVEYNIEIVSYGPLSSDIGAFQQQRNDCAIIGPGQCEADSSVLPEPASGSQSSIIESKNVFQNHAMDYAGNILNTDIDGCLSCDHSKPKTDDVSLESTNNNLLQNDQSEECSATGMIITQSPNNSRKAIASQSLPFNLDRCSKQNHKQISVATLSTDQVFSYKFPIPNSYKYRLVSESVNCTDITADRKSKENKSDPNSVLSLSNSKTASPLDSTKNTLQNWSFHTDNRNSPKIHGVDNVQNYKSEKKNTPPAVAVKQNLSTITNKSKSSTNYPISGNNSETITKNISKTVNEEPPTRTITPHLNQNTSLTYSFSSGGNENVPKCVTDSTPAAQDSQSDQPPLPDFTVSQDKSLTHFPLNDNPVMDPETIKNTESYQSDKEIPVSPQVTATSQLSPPNTLSKTNKSLIQKPVKSDLIKNLENEQSANYKVALLLNVEVDLKTPSETTFQNQVQNSADTTMLRGITKDNKQLYEFKIDVAPSVQDTAFNQSLFKDNTFLNEHKPLCYSSNRVHTTENRKSPDSLQTGNTSQQLISNIIHINQKKQLVHPLFSNDIHVHGEHSQVLQENISESYGKDPAPEMLTVLHFTTTSTDIKKGAVRNDLSKGTEIAHNQKSCDRNEENDQLENHQDSQSRVIGQRTPTNSTPGQENIQQNLYQDNDHTIYRRFNKDNVLGNKSETPHVSSTTDSEIGQQFSTNIAPRYKYLSQYYTRNSLHVTLGREGNKHLEKDSTEPTLPSSVTDQQTSISAYNKINPHIHVAFSADSTLDAKVIRNTKHDQSEESSPIVSQDILTDQRFPPKSVCNLDNSVESANMESNENFQKQQAKTGTDTSPFSPNRSTTNVKKNTLQHYITKVTDIYHHRRSSAKFKLNVLKKTKSAPSPCSAESSQWLPENSLQRSNLEESKFLSMVRDNDKSLAHCENTKEYQSDKYSAVSTWNRQWKHQAITAGRKNMLESRSPNFDDITVVSKINNSCTVDKFETDGMTSPLDQETNQFSPTDSPHRHEHKPVTYLLNSAAVNAHRESPSYLEKCKEEPKCANLAEDKTPQQKSTSPTDSYKDKPLSHSSVITDISAINQNNSHIPPALDPASFYNTSKNITNSSKYKTLSISLNSATDTTDIGDSEHLQKNSPEINKIPAVHSLSDIQSMKTTTDIKKDALQNDPSKVPEILHDKKSFHALTFKTTPAANSAPSPLAPVTSQSFPTTVLQKSYSLTQSQLDGDTMNKGCIEYLLKDHSHLSTRDSLGDQLLPANDTCDNMNESHSQTLLFDHLPVGPGGVCNVENYQSKNHGGDSPGRVISQKTPTNIALRQENTQQNLCPENDYTTLNRRFNTDNVQHYKSERLHIFSTSDSEIGQEFSINIAQGHKYPSQNYSPNSAHVILNREGNKHLEKDSTEPTLPSSVTDQQTSISAQNKINPHTHLPFSADSTVGAKLIKNTEQYQSEESSPIVSQDSLTDQRSPNSIRNLDKPLPHSLESGDKEMDENLQRQQAKTGNDSTPLYPFSPNRSAASVKKNTLQHYITKVSDIYRHRRPSAKFNLNVLHKTKSAPSPSSAETSLLLPENNVKSSNQEESKFLSLFRDDMAGTRKVESQSGKSLAISTADELNGHWTQQNIAGGKKNILESCSPSFDDITLVSEINNFGAVDKFETEYVTSPLDQETNQFSPTGNPHRHEHKPVTYFLNSAAVNAHKENPNCLEKCKEEPKSTNLAEDKTPQQKSTSPIDSYKDKPLNHSSVITDVSAINQNNSHIPPALDPASFYNTSKNITDSSKYKTLNSATDTTDFGHSEHLQKSSPEINKIPAVHSLNDIQSMKTNSAPSFLAPVTSQSLTPSQKSHSLTQSQLDGDSMMDRGCDENLQKDHSHLSTPDSLGDQVFPANGTCDNINESHSQTLLIDHHPVSPGGVCNVENYQSESAGGDSPGRVISQRTSTNTARGQENIQQNLCPETDYTTLNRRFNKDNAQHYKSERPHISSTSDSGIGQEFSIKIAQEHKYQSQNYSPCNKINPLTLFPVSADSSLDAEVIKNTDCQYEESSPTVSHDTLTDQKFPPSSIRNLDKPLPHSLESGDIEIDDNLQRQQTKTGSDSAPFYSFRPNRSAINVKENTLQQCIAKVTDIYRHRRPSAKFKLNILKKTKSAPSPCSAESSQWLPENNLQSSNLEESKALSLDRGDMAGSRKYQTGKDSAISTADELNGQWTHQNITEGRKNTLDSRSSNSDGITVDREINNVSDVDKIETECMPSPLNRVCSQVSSTDSPHRPATYLLNSAAVSALRESPSYLEKCKQETTSMTATEDKITQQKSPTCMADSYKDEQLCYPSVTNDVNTINQDKFKITHVLSALDPVSRHHSSKNIIHSSKSKILSFSLNSATVTADTGVNEHLQKDSPEVNNIPALDSASCIQSTIMITDIEKNARPNVSSRLAEINVDKIPYDRLKFKGFHKTCSAPSSPLRVTKQRPTTDVTHNNHEKSPTHSIMSSEFIMNRRKNSYLQKYKPETNNEFSLAASLAGQQSPSKIVNSKEHKSPAHSPNRNYVLDPGDMRNLKVCQPENNREAFFKKPIGLQSYTDISGAKTAKFQHWFPDGDMSLNQRCTVNIKHCKSETDISSSLQNLPIHQESFIDMTSRKKSNYLRESAKSGYFTSTRTDNNNCEHIDSHLNNNISSSHDLLPALLSPENIVHYNRNAMCDHSLTNAEFLAQNCDNAKERGKISKCRRKSFRGEIFPNQALRTRTKNTKGSNALQQCSPEEGQTDSDLSEINNFHNRLNAYSDFSQYRANSSGIDEGDHSILNDKYQARTARFSKMYHSLRHSLRPNPQNIQSRCGNLYKTESLKDINYNQSTFQDHENVFSTNRLYNFQPAVRNKQVITRLQFSSCMKSSKLYRCYSDIPFSNENEFDQNNWATDHGNKIRLDNHELVIGNEDKTNVSKEEKRKETHLENMERVLVVDRLWKPEYLHKRVSSPRSEDVFNPLTSGINQDPGVNDDTEGNHEYFPVDIKLFWPKENPTDIIRLLSSSSTGSKVSEDSLSPHHHCSPAAVDKQNFSCYSDTNSDTTTDDEYFLDGNDTVKESVL
ncbi:uncharacterized protein LOC109937345 [Rhincodon typus]|uniref:uncharacterized protein LOC109937345 n=1 Tax=Rhincodon typus TaxID=259920 RepID=UPI00202E8B9F|nr:uncharacterized protein LOC109937345 [Rhincodon typus]